MTGPSIEIVFSCGIRLKLWFFRCKRPAFYAEDHFRFSTVSYRELGWRNLPGPVPEAVRDLPSSRLWQRCVTTIFDSSADESFPSDYVEAPA